MKTIEDAKRFLRLCNATTIDMVNNTCEGVEALSETDGPCYGICPECDVRDTLMWVWPELKGYNEEASEEEWAKYVKEKIND